MNDHDEDYAYINQDLDDLAKVEAQLDLLALTKTELYDSLLTDDIKQRMAEIDAEYDGKIAAAELNIAQLRHEIRQGILEHGATVKGEFLMATWNKGRESWDTKALKGYAAAHPDVLQLKKTGNPSVTIRTIK